MPTSSCASATKLLKVQTWSQMRNYVRSNVNDIIENLALMPSPATIERFQPMFTSLLTKLKTHRASGTISAAPVKSIPSFTKTVLRQVSDKHHKHSERMLARDGDSGGGGDARGDGHGRY